MKRRPQSRFISCLNTFLLISMILFISYMCLEVVFLVFVGPTATQVLINYIEIQQNKEALVVARTQWKAKGITDYKITINNNSLAPANLLSCRLEDTLTIRDRKVVEASRLAECHEVYEQLIAEKMFDLVEDELAKADPFVMEVHIEFDSEFGFVSIYAVNKYPPGGIFGNSIGHPIIVRVSDLVVLDEP